MNDDDWIDTSSTSSPLHPILGVNQCLRALDAPGVGVNSFCVSVSNSSRYVDAFLIPFPTEEE